MHVFKCSYCDTKTSELRWIKEHYDTWHPDKKVFPCETCGKLFTRKHDLERHIKEAHSETEKNLIQCTHCEYSTNRKSYLNRHVKSRHNKPNFSCSMCEKSFNWKKT